MPRISGSRCGWRSWMTFVASPPSSSTIFGVQPPGPLSVCSMHHSYSSSVSPFQAKTGTPRAAIAAAAWSWVEKMLHELQRTLAPSSISVSISTAVWIVMCRQPVMRAPASGFEAPYSSRSAIRPGISVSAIAISRRPQSARPISATLWSMNSGIRISPSTGRHSASGETYKDIFISSTPVAGAAQPPSIIALKSSSSVAMRLESD
jgi:hypothetical protein